MKVTQVKLYKMEAEQKSDIKFSDLAMNLDIKGGKVLNDVFRVDFTYLVSYEPNVAAITFHGYAIIEGTKLEIDKLRVFSNKETLLLKDISEDLVNAIAFYVQSNSILVAATMNMPPPLFSPKIHVYIKAKK